MANQTTERTQGRERGSEEILDIVELIMLDHEPLKELIEVLKDTDRDLEERKEAFEDFAWCLVSHAKPEEDTLYNAMKANAELRQEGFEGEVEHALADQLLEEIERETDDDMWSAKAKVLAELVEHHIEEEEGELLPDVEEELTDDQRMRLAERFLQLKVQILAEGADDSPTEEMAMELEADAEEGEETYAEMTSNAFEEDDEDSGQRH